LPPPLMSDDLDGEGIRPREGVDRSTHDEGVDEDGEEDDECRGDPARDPAYAAAVALDPFRDRQVTPGCPADEENVDAEREHDQPHGGAYGEHEPPQLGGARGTVTGGIEHRLHAAAPGHDEQSRREECPPHGSVGERAPSPSAASGTRLRGGRSGGSKSKSSPASASTNAT